MKIANETKIGILVAVAIVFFIFGFNFLKGRAIVNTGNYLFVKYHDAKGLVNSNPVYVNGFQVGIISDIQNIDANLTNMLITIRLKDKYNIPVNSVASVKSNPLASSSIDIKLGSEKNYLHSGDTLQSEESLGIFNELTKRFDPITAQLKTTFQSLDSVLKNINSILDPKAKTNLQTTIANITATTASLSNASLALEAMLNKQNGVISKSMDNIESVSNNLAQNNSKITGILTNVEKTTDNFSKADIDGTIAKLNTAMDHLNQLLEKVASTDGTIGLLLNDKKLYNNINSTIRSANTLVDDLRLHPKRYLNISVFGKKVKQGPLMSPLKDTTQP